MTNKRTDLKIISPNINGMDMKYVKIIIAVILVSIISITTPVQAADFAGHSFSESHFAVEVDLEPGATAPDLINDLLNASTGTGDSNEFEDLQFYMAYMNNSGIEVAFSALEKMEHNLTLGNLLAPSIENTLRALPGTEIKEALDTTIFHVNATAPFQQLVQHFTTPWEEDVFVTNNFMCLIAYSAGPDDQTLDAEDELYIGYTFSVQELIDAVNDVLVTNGHSDDQIGHFEYESSFEQTTDSYKFGIEYTNMFVLWQHMEVAPRGVDIFSAGSSFIKPDTGGVVFGQDIVAASVLDHIGFEYEFKTQEITGANEYVLGTVTSHYNIGETNFLVTKDDQSFIDDHADNWTSSPFVEAPSYTFEIPATLQNYEIPLTSLTMPASVTVNLGELAFYLNDDAKARINMQNGFGLTVATATTTFGVSVEDTTYEDNLGTTHMIGLQMGGNTFFHTDFVGKETYKLLGLDDLMGIDPTVDRPVHIVPFAPNGWAIHNVAKAYFAVEFALAYGFTKFIAQELTSQYFNMPAGTAEVYVNTVLYFTFTEFPEWFGGEILHDPVYSAVAAPVANSDVTADWGDVVDVKYSLWYDAAHTQEAPGNIGVTLTYIYLSYGSTVPSEVSSLYPEANPNYLQAFKEAVIGLEENEEKDFVITKEELPTGYSEYDLYYHIELVKLWYDANAESSTSITTTTSTTTTTTAITTTSDETNTTTTSTTTMTTSEIITSIPVITPSFTYLTLLIIIIPILISIRKRR